MGRTIIKEDAFEQFLMRLEPELSTVDDRYRRLRAKLVKFFEWKRCEDPPALADETIGRLMDKIYVGDQIEKPSSYAYGVARNLYKEHLRKKAKLAGILDDLEITAPESDKFVEYARHCVQQLPDDQRELLEQYYSDDTNREELARTMGTSIAGLRTKVHRIRNQVKDCYKKCIMESR